MSKNNMGKVLAFLAGAGAAAAAIAYFVRYKAFNKELEKDFHAFEDEELDDGDEEDPLEDLNNPSHRNYVSLSSSKDEFKAAAKDVKESVGAAASAAKDVLKDTAAVLKDTAYEAASAAKDTAHLASATVKDTLDSYKDIQETVEQMAEEAASEIADAADAISDKIDKALHEDPKETTTVEEITE